MGASILTSTAHVLGVDIPTMEVVVTNRTGGTTIEGDLHQFDMTLSQTEVTNYIPGDAASAFANIIPCTVADRDTGLFCVVKEVPVHLTSIGDNERTGVYLWARDIKVQVNNAHATTTFTGPTATANGAVFYSPDIAPFDAAHIPSGAVGKELDPGTRRLGSFGVGASLGTTTAAVIDTGVFDGWGDAFGIHRFGAIGS